MNCTQHDGHEHPHGPSCGHTTLEHGDHTDYLHEGHMHYVHVDHVDEHRLEHSAACTPDHDCQEHESFHNHGAGCGHEAVPHADHTDYLVAGHLHSPHVGHCDHHGDLKVTKA